MLTNVVVGFGALIVFYAWLQAFERRGVATGTIVKIEKDADEIDVPVVRFEVGMQKYEFRPSLTLRREGKKKSIGSRVRVAYNPRDPLDADIGTPVRRYLPAAIVTIAYVVFVWFAYWAK